MFSWPIGELPSLDANEIRPAGRLYVCTRGRALRLPGSGLLAPAPHGRSLRAQSKARSFRIKHAEATRNWRGSEDSGRLGTKSVLEPRVGARITRASFWSGDRKHCRSEEHTSELQSLMRISYAVFCLKKNK